MSRRVVQHGCCGWPSANRCRRRPPPASALPPRIPTGQLPAPSHPSPATARLAAAGRQFGAAVQRGQRAERSGGRQAVRGALVVGRGWSMVELMGFVRCCWTRVHLQTACVDLLLPPHLQSLGQLPCNHPTAPHPPTLPLPHAPQELAAFLRADLPHLFDDQGIDASKYDEAVVFEDPITYYTNIKGRKRGREGGCWLLGREGGRERGPRCCTTPVLPHQWWCCHQQQATLPVECLVLTRVVPARHSPHPPTNSATTCCHQPRHNLQSNLTLQATCSTSSSCAECSSPPLCCTMCGAPGPWSSPPGGLWP